MLPLVTEFSIILPEFSLILPEFSLFFKIFGGLWHPVATPLHICDTVCMVTYSKIKNSVDAFSESPYMPACILMLYFYWCLLMSKLANIYSDCSKLSDTIFYFRIGHHTGTVWSIMYAVVMCIELYYIIYFMLYLFIKLTCIKLFNNIFSVVTHDYCCVSTFYFNKVWINTSGVI